MKCHVCNGKHVYLANRAGDIKMSLPCPHCKGTRNEPFNAEVELAELKRKVEALEKSKPTLPERPCDEINFLVASALGCHAMTWREVTKIFDYITALEKECGK
jgi:hypothetical protein